jgi:hypothetical protein
LARLWPCSAFRPFELPAKSEITLELNDPTMHPYDCWRWCGGTCALLTPSSWFSRMTL